MCDEFRLKRPFTLLVSGPSGSASRFAYPSCITSKHCTCIYLMVVSSGAIARRVPFPRQLAGTKNVRFNECLSADFNNAKV